MLGLSEGIEILEYNDAGYRSLVFFEGWRVALMNDGSRTTVEGLTYFQQHLETDEVFALLSGRCVLILAGNMDVPGKITAVDMEPGKLYNIKKGVWHTHVFYENTKVLIVENADTDDTNSPISDITPEQRKTIALLCG